MYIGPETIMPLASAVAAISGVVLLFWRKIKGFFRMTAHLITRLVSR